MIKPPWPPSLHCAIPFLLSLHSGRGQILLGLAIVLQCDPVSLSQPCLHTKLTSHGFDDTAKRADENVAALFVFRDLRLRDLKKLGHLRLRQVSETLPQLLESDLQDDLARFAIVLRALVGREVFLTELAIRLSPHRFVLSLLLRIPLSGRQRGRLPW